MRQVPELSVSQILAWADFYHKRTGRWPQASSRFVYNSVGEKWRRIDKALRRGYRGLPGKSSLARLLAEHRGVRNPKGLPPLANKLILAWADAYYRRHKSWPKKLSGSIPEAPGETWELVNNALQAGDRGLPRGSSLAQLLERERGIRNHLHLPRLTHQKILGWADAYHRRTGKWPIAQSGQIPEAPGETWSRV